MELLNFLEEGQFLIVRNVLAAIKDVYSYEKEDKTYTLLRLEVLDGTLGNEEIEVIWEREVHKEILDTSEFPKPGNWDSYRKFKAFLLSLNWTSLSFLNRKNIISPFKSAVKFEEYQIEPVLKALGMNRVSLLLADDVGLGKTIEAGLIIQEMISRFSINKILIICPASLQYQWKEEMKSKFNLEFQVIDRSYINRLKREYGFHVNPWSSFPRIITSMDFIKRPDILNLFRQSIGQVDNWDLLIVDEVHNCAPSGRRRYVKDSDRTKMLKEIAPLFEHRLFLTATPHNGYTESFTALLEMLDPYRFVRGKKLEKTYLHQVMVRRIKDDILNPDGSRKFPKRVIKAIEVELSSEEESIFKLLSKYISNINQKLSKDSSSYSAARFVLTLLKKRLLSSPLAFFRSIAVHIDNLTKPENRDLKLVKALSQKIEEDLDNDEEKTFLEQELITECSKFFEHLTEEENRILDEMYEKASFLKDNPNKDSKLLKLIGWIEENLRDNGDWARERLIIFTEYKDTLDYLYENLKLKYGEDVIRVLYGGMSFVDRKNIKSVFQESPDENSVRILIATDAASEGLNLQNYCRNVIHYEIPWNPNKLEQRNGRVDRHGQKFKEVYIHHFKYRNNEDSEFLDVIVQKIMRMRTDIGSVSQLLEKNIETAMLGEESKQKVIKSKEYDERIENVREDLKTLSVKQQNLLERTRKLKRIYEDTKKRFGISPQNIRLILEVALEMEGGVLESVEVEGKEYLFIKKLPYSWKHLESYVKDKNTGTNYLLTFSIEESMENKNLVYLYLDHPLIRQAILSFRKRFWSQDEKLRKVSYKIVKDLEYLCLVAFVRFVAVNLKGKKLDERIIPMSFRIEKDSLLDFTIDWKVDGYYAPIPVSLARDLRKYYLVHKKVLFNKMIETKEEEKERLLIELEKLKNEEITRVRHLINERIREIRKRLEAWDKDYMQPLLFKELQKEELQQIKEDKILLEHRLDQLKERLKKEPKLISEKYTLKNVSMFPIGLLYLIPETMIGDSQ